MFEAAGLSVAVANASDDIKSKADYITLSNDEDGVAVFLETLIKQLNSENVLKKSKFIPKRTEFDLTLSCQVV